MKPHTYYMELRQQKRQKSYESATGGYAWYNEPPIAETLADTLRTVATGFFLFSSTALISAGAGVIDGVDLTLAESLRVASGVTGIGWLARSVLMSETLLFWIETLTGKDINQDGVIGEPEAKPEPSPAPLPSENWAESSFSSARKMWEFAHKQIRGARDDGRKLRGKPWARRTVINKLKFTQDDWENAIDVWVAGGLIKARDARTPETDSFKRGLDKIDQGMIALGYMRRNGEWWIPK